jgi:hypothetical protein
MKVSEVFAMGGDYGNGCGHGGYGGYDRRGLLGILG